MVCLMDGGDSKVNAAAVSDRAKSERRIARASSEQFDIRKGLVAIIAGAISHGKTLRIIRG
jgi:uncharacterized protein YggU (UPF0235/DUF167 family)